MCPLNPLVCRHNASYPAEHTFLEAAWVERTNHGARRDADAGPLMCQDCNTSHRFRSGPRGIRLASSGDGQGYGRQMADVAEGAIFVFRRTLAAVKAKCIKNSQGDRAVCGNSPFSWQPFWFRPSPAARPTPMATATRPITRPSGRLAARRQVLLSLTQLAAAKRRARLSGPLVAHCPAAFPAFLPATDLKTANRSFLNLQRPSGRCPGGFFGFCASIGACLKKGPRCSRRS